LLPEIRKERVRLQKIGKGKRKGKQKPERELKKCGREKGHKAV